MSRVLVIGDTHCPAMDMRYLKFLGDLADQWRVDKFVHVGDLVDWASISFHPKAVSLKNSEREFEQAFTQVEKLYGLFDDVEWLIGNHDALTERQAQEVGLPKASLRNYLEIWQIPKWRVIPRFGNIMIDGVQYRHGDSGKGGGVCPAFSQAQAEFCSVVQGHYHAAGGVVFGANNKAKYFGAQTGCGINIKAAAFEYQWKFSKRPVLGALVVIDGHPYFEPMNF